MYLHIWIVKKNATLTNFVAFLPMIAASTDATSKAILEIRFKIANLSFPDLITAKLQRYL